VNLRLWMPVGLGLVILLLAAFRRLHVGAPRRRLRRTTILYALYLLTLAAAPLSHWVGALEAVPPLDTAALLLGTLIVINLSALILFDGLFGALEWHYPDILHDLAVGAAYVVAIGWLLHRIGVNVSSLLTTSAVVTAVIGLSLQATLVNIVGGLALQFDESISEGDWIELENKTQGQVKKVRWRHTVIETRDWDTLIVPNAMLLSQTFKVLGRREGAPALHRMWVYFNVDYRYAPGDVIHAVNGALQSAPIPNAASEPTPHCICYDFARDGRNSFAHYAVRYWLSNLAADDPTSSAVRERIFAGLRRAQIPLAVPGTTVFVSQDDPDHAARKADRDAASRVDAIERVELFARLSPEEKAQLAATARMVPFAPGELLTRQGAQAHWLYILTRGQAEVRVAHADGSEKKVAELCAPTFFGEMALMTGEAREATVVALSDVDCLRIDKEGLQSILTKRPQIAQEMSVILAQRRVELRAVRDNLDAEARQNQLVSERGKILASMRDFFGLSAATQSGRPPAT
jgi:small-conductance mechanosensitive channel/CRP-like cAMP-binding protein